MQRIIIGIHGLGNKPNQALLETWWKKSLYEGLSRIEHPRRRIPFELCYWADILHTAPLHPLVRDRNDARYLDEPYLPFASLRPIKPSIIRRALLGLFEKQLNRLKLDAEGNIIWKHITDLILRRYFADLDCYYSNCLKPVANGVQPVRDRIRQRLAETLQRHSDKEILLIAHSMGAIIAYDVLAHVMPEAPVHSLITIGAPLGVPVVVQKIKKEWGLTPGLPPTPDAITGGWYNIADLEDKVAFDYRLSDDYAPNRHQVAPADLQVINDYVVRDRRNPHKDYGYLRTPELARICFEFSSQGQSDALIRRLDLGYMIYEWLIGLPQFFRQVPYGKRTW